MYHMSRSLRPAALLATLLLAACGDAPRVSGPVGCAAFPTLAASPARVPVTSAYDSLFAAVGEEMGVPPAMLRAISYVETGWRMVEGVEEHGQAPAHGLMALRGERLARAAALGGLPLEAVRGEPEANVRAAAALLRAEAEAAGVLGRNAREWGEVIGRFSGIGLADGRESYAREVLSVMDGRRSDPAPFAAQALADPCGGGPVAPPPAPVTDFSGARWYPSPNYNSRMSGEGGQVHLVIVHSCEGGYTGCWAWLGDRASGVSAHYVVREDGAEITQLVREAERAWHIGAVYDSTLNAGHAGHLHGVQSNHFTIGIEHAGFASQTSWPVEQVDASARLVCDISRRWAIPRDRLHIVSHGQLQPYNRTDPGAHWPWADYLARIERYCGG